MERVVAAETETGQLASDGPGPPTESPTTAGMAKTRLREPQAVFAMVTSLGQCRAPACAVLARDSPVSSDSRN